MGPAADVYALGAVFYATLTGRPPFQAATAVATLQQVLNDEPVALSRLNRAIPNDLETISLKCLAKSPARRYASAAALGDDLDRWLQGEAILARPTPVGERVIKWARRRPTVAALSVSLVAITLVAFVLITGFWFSARRLAAQLAMDKATRLCEEGDINRGLLFFGYTLSLIPPQDKDLRDAVLANIAAWSQEAIPLLGLLPHPLAITAQQFSPNSEYLLTVCKDDCLRIWSVPDGKLLVRVPHSAPILFAVFSPDSKYILTGCDDGAALWDMNSGYQITWKHTGPVNCAIFYDGGKHVAVGSKKGLRCLNVPDGGLAEDPRIEGNITALAVSKDGKTLAVGVANQGVQLRDKGKVEMKTPELKGVQGEIQTLKFGGDGQLLLATAVDEHRTGMIHVWRVATGELVPGLASRWEMADADVDAVEPLVFTAGADFTAEMFDLSPDVPQKLIHLDHDDAVGTVALGPRDRAVLLTGSNSSVARLWDRKTGLAIGPALQHPSQLEKVAFSPNGDFFVTICGDTLVRLWQAPKRRNPPIAHPSAVMAVAVSSQGLIATGTSAGDLYIRQLSDDTEVQHTKQRMTTKSGRLLSPATAKH